jgi:alkanesulfonate monooxygenase SsuD/methylene tetrahydromethanopterin reductase-like flavin-dependent oxidoreductase (luciferase family)
VTSITVSISPPQRFWRASLAERRADLAAIADAGLDGLHYADHVSFRGGHGTDALVLLGALSQLEERLTLHAGVYLLPLRHPVPVARQLATLAELAPGRVHLGVGVGGEDRHEIEVCGVDPRTRGRRCDESLTVLRGLLTGRPVSFHGSFFELDDALIVPPPDPPIPIVVGGRSDAAVRRAGIHGDGWLAAWVSHRRFGEAVELCAATAETAGRDPSGFRHGLQLWVGLDPAGEPARGYVAEAMEAFYGVPFATFERYTPAGTAAEVADQLSPYVAAGARYLALTPCSANADLALEQLAEVRRLLVSRSG